MSEEQVFIDLAGREFQGNDVNRVGLSSGLADDRVLAELLRMVPYDGSTISKGVLPYGVAGSTPAGVIKPRTGGIDIYPLRAIVGSRTAVATDSKKWWQDIRSALLLATGADHLSVAIANGDVSNPRWDLVYVTLAVDSTFGETRYKKDPTTKIVSAGTQNTYKKTTATVNVLAGTPGASPARPALPADSGSNYNIPLGYVRVATGFTGATTLGGSDVFEVAPILRLANGAMSIEPANGLYKDGGSLLTRIPWPASLRRPAPFLPAGFEGGVIKIVQLQLASAATKSAADGDIIDDSIDWRGRLFFTAFQFHATNRLATDTNLIPATSFTGVPVQGASCGIDMGASMTTDFNSTGKQRIFNCNSGSHLFYLYVDAATGALKIDLSAGNPDLNIVIWLFCSAQFVNRADG